MNFFVSALAVSGTEVLVGGGFTQANVGGTVVAANRVARFSTSTNTWSALGTGGGNGVNDGVFALAVSGTEVFVGGFFSQANVGAGTTIASSFIGRYFNTSGSVSANSLTFTYDIVTSGTPDIGFVNTAPTPSALPTGITTVAPYFWTITPNSLVFTNGQLQVPFSAISGVTNPNTLRFLRRDNASSAWVNLGGINDGTTLLSATPFAQGGQVTIGDAGGGNPLPVELASFTGKPVQNGVELRWTTASEKNNAGFEVQRMENGENWRVLGFVKGNGTTAQSQSYSFVDRTASGKVQYRLKQIDFDGQFEILPTVEVEAGLPRTFELGQNYPNPFNPSTVISYQLPVSGQVSLKVYDMLGREVATLVNTRQEAGRYQTSFNAASLSSGMYFYRLQAGTFVQTNKMMLVK